MTPTRKSLEVYIKYLRKWAFNQVQKKEKLSIIMSLKEIKVGKIAI